MAPDRRKTVKESSVGLIGSGAKVQKIADLNKAWKECQKVNYNIKQKLAMLELTNKGDCGAVKHAQGKLLLFEAVAELPRPHSDQSIADKYVRDGLVRLAAGVSQHKSLPCALLFAETLRHVRQGLIPLVDREWELLVQVDLAVAAGQDVTVEWKDPTENAVKYSSNELTFGDVIRGSNPHEQIEHGKKMLLDVLELALTGSVPHKNVQAWIREQRNSGAKDVVRVSGLLFQAVSSDPGFMPGWHAKLSKVAERDSQHKLWRTLNNSEPAEGLRMLEDRKAAREAKALEELNEKAKRIKPIILKKMQKMAPEKRYDFIKDLLVINKDMLDRALPADKAKEVVAMMCHHQETKSRFTAALESGDKLPDPWEAQVESKESAAFLQELDALVSRTAQEVGDKEKKPLLPSTLVQMMGPQSSLLYHNHIPDSTNDAHKFRKEDWRHLLHLLKVGAVHGEHRVTEKAPGFSIDAPLDKIGAATLAPLQRPSRQCESSPEVDLLHIFGDSTYPGGMRVCWAEVCGWLNSPAGLSCSGQQTLHGVSDDCYLELENKLTQALHRLHLASLAQKVVTMNRLFSGGLEEGEGQALLQQIKVLDQLEECDACIAGSLTGEALWENAKAAGKREVRAQFNLLQELKLLEKAELIKTPGRGRKRRLATRSRRTAPDRPFASSTESVHEQEGESARDKAIYHIFTFLRVLQSESLLTVLAVHLIACYLVVSLRCILQVLQREAAEELVAMLPTLEDVTWQHILLLTDTQLWDLREEVEQLYSRREHLLCKTASRQNFLANVLDNVTLFRVEREEIVMSPTMLPNHLCLGPPLAKDGDEAGEESRQKLTAAKCEDLVPVFVESLMDQVFTIRPLEILGYSVMSLGSLPISQLRNASLGLKELEEYLSVREKNISLVPQLEMLAKDIQDAQALQGFQLESRLCDSQWCGRFLEVFRRILGTTREMHGSSLASRLHGSVFARVEAVLGDLVKSLEALAEAQGSKEGDDLVQNASSLCRMGWEAMVEDFASKILGDNLPQVHLLESECLLEAQLLSAKEWVENTAQQCVESHMQRLLRAHISGLQIKMEELAVAEEELTRKKLQDELITEEAKLTSAAMAGKKEKKKRKQGARKAKAAVAEQATARQSAQGSADEASADEAKPQAREPEVDSVMEDFRRRQAEFDAWSATLATASKVEEWTEVPSSKGRKGVTADTASTATMVPAQDAQSTADSQGSDGMQAALTKSQRTREMRKNKAAARAQQNNAGASDDRKQSEVPANGRGWGDAAEVALDADWVRVQRSVDVQRAPRPADGDWEAAVQQDELREKEREQRRLDEQRKEASLREQQRGGSREDSRRPWREEMRLGQGCLACGNTSHCFANCVYYRIMSPEDQKRMCESHGLPHKPVTKSGCYLCGGRHNLTACPQMPESCTHEERDALISTGHKGQGKAVLEAVTRILDGSSGAPPTPSRQPSERSERPARPPTGSWAAVAHQGGAEARQPPPPPAEPPLSSPAKQDALPGQWLQAVLSSRPTDADASNFEKSRNGDWGSIDLGSGFTPPQGQQEGGLPQPRKGVWLDPPKTWGTWASQEGAATSPSPAPAKSTPASPHWFMGWEGVEWGSQPAVFQSGPQGSGKKAPRGGPENGDWESLLKASEPHCREQALSRAPKIQGSAIETGWWAEEPQPLRHEDTTTNPGGRSVHAPPAAASQPSAIGHKQAAEFNGPVQWKSVSGGSLPADQQSSDTTWALFRKEPSASGTERHSSREAWPLRQSAVVERTPAAAAAAKVDTPERPWASLSSPEQDVAAPQTQQPPVKQGDWASVLLDLPDACSPAGSPKSKAAVVCSSAAGGTQQHKDRATTSRFPQPTLTGSKGAWCGLLQAPPAEPHRKPREWHQPPLDMRQPPRGHPVPMHLESEVVLLSRDQCSGAALVGPQRTQQQPLAPSQQSSQACNVQDSRGRASQPLQTVLTTSEKPAASAVRTSPCWEPGQHFQGKVPPAGPPSREQTAIMPARPSPKQGVPPPRHPAQVGEERAPQLQNLQAITVRQGVPGQYAEEPAPMEAYLFEAVGKPQTPVHGQYSRREEDCALHQSEERPGWAEQQGYACAVERRASSVNHSTQQQYIGERMAEPQPSWAPRPHAHGIVPRRPMPPGFAAAGYPQPPPDARTPPSLPPPTAPLPPGFEPLAQLSPVVGPQKLSGVPISVSALPGAQQAPQPLTVAEKEDTMDDFMNLLGVNLSSMSSPQSVPKALPGIALPTYSGVASAQAAGEPQEDEEDAELQKALQASLAETHSQAAAAAVEASSAALGQLSVGTPGLQNNAGEYNCFLNCVVQCLWHCNDFRSHVKQWGPQQIQGNAVVMALVELFRCFAEEAAQKQTGKRAECRRLVVAPAALRQALHDWSENSFRIGEMSDAAEVLSAVYENLMLVADGSQLVARLFQWQVHQQVECPACGKVTHNTRHTQTFYHTFATALREEAAAERERGGAATLGTLMANVEGQAKKSCDTDAGGCGRMCSVKHRLYMHSKPARVFTLQLGWECAQESGEAIKDAMALISEDIDIAQVFEGAKRAHIYRLRCMVCYYGLHYFAFVREGEVWRMFDDTVTSEIGDWAAVQLKCHLGKIQPSVLFFEVQPARL